MATKINESISRLRGQVKAEVQDAFVTDRYLYSLIVKYAQVLMRRQDFANKLMKFNPVWKSLPYIELIDVDKVEAHCSGVQSHCTIKRSKAKIPEMIEGYWGPLIRTVSSIDSSIEAQATQPGTFTSITQTTSFKYNNTKYFWFLNGYIYLPNVDWDAVRLEGIFDDEIGAWLCDEVEQCVPRYEQDMNIPQSLFAEIEAQVVQAMMMTVQIPVVDGDNKVDVNR